MLPRIAEISPTHTAYLDFIQALRQGGFHGDSHFDYANRVVQATDNSIYQVLPQATVYPRDTQDLQLIAQLTNDRIVIVRMHDMNLFAESRWCSLRLQRPFPRPTPWVARSINGA